MFLPPFCMMEVNMFDVVAIGELLVDFTYHGRSENGMRLFEQNPGGAPANVLCALANLGLNVAFIGKVGKDMHGDFLRSVLLEKGIDTSGLIIAGDVFTTLAFVELSESGERAFSFARKPGADTCLLPGEVKSELLKNCKIFHFGAVCLSNEPSRTTTIEAAKAAKAAGAIISFDPNYRESLWKNTEEAAKVIGSVLSFVDVIKISDEEMELLTGSVSYEAAADILLKKGISCAVITLGENGSYAAVKDASIHVPALKVPVIDTTGAGDAFWGGFLYQLAKTGYLPDSYTKLELKKAVTFASAVASLCIQKRGGIPAMPDEAAVTSFLKSQK